MEGTTVRVTPLMGVGEEAPLCSLLEIGRFTALLDCGWDDRFTPGLLEEVRRHLPRVDAVLLSHPSPAHLGALTALLLGCDGEGGGGGGGLSPTARIYATKPVRRMGELFMRETALSHQAESDFAAFTPEQVQAAFRSDDRWVELRYQQRLALGGRGAGITICPHPAGRYIGGSVWVLTLEWCGQQLGYAVDFDHRRERLLTGTTFHEVLAAGGQQPALLISDAVNALAPRTAKDRRDEEIIDAIMCTVGGGGNVLVPVDVAGRCLELALMLDEHFARARTGATLVLLSSCVDKVIEYGNKSLEYMSTEAVQRFSAKHTEALKWQKLVLARSIDELNKIAGPKVVLATLPTLDAGPSRQLLVDWAGLPRNTIIFVERANMGTLAAQLQHHVPGPEPQSLTLELGRRVPLEGEELEAWQADKAKEAAAAEAAAAAARAMADPIFGLLPGAKAPSSDGSSSLQPPATPTAAAHQTLRASSGSISKLVRDAATGTVVQQLVGAGPSGGGGGGSALAGRHGGVGGGLDDAVLLDGFEPPKGAVAPMFPDEDAWMDEQWDEYGAALAKDEFKEPLRDSAFALRPAADPMDASGGGVGAFGDGPDGADGGGSLVVEDEAEEVPTKLVVRQVEVQVRAAIRLFEYEGRADSDALKAYLAHAAPRRLVLLRGAEEARASLAHDLRASLADYGTRIYTPGPGEAVEAGLAPSATVVLGEELAAALKDRPVGHYNVAWVEGRLGAADPQAGTMALQPLAAGGASGGAGPNGSGNGEGTEGGVLLAQAGATLTLTKLIPALATAGFQTTFAARGVLAVPLTPYEAVYISWAGGHSGDKATFTLQGPLGDGYYRVRDIIYSQFGAAC